MEIRCIDKAYPVWELTKLELPSLNVTELKGKENNSKLPINSKREPMYLDWSNSNHFHFKETWVKRKELVQEYLKSGRAYEECIELMPMWPNRFAKFEWGTGEGSVQIIHDRTGFHMGPHIDNREVVGVMIVNLQDNPEGSGTNFHVDRDTPEAWYSGPTKRNTGVFFLNNWNTWHSVQNNGHDRLICYDIMHLGEMFRNG